MSIKIEIFSSPGCSKCGHAKELLRKLVAELSDELNGEAGHRPFQWCEVNILEELDHAVELGVLSTPSIAIDNKLVFTSLPSTRKLRSELLSRLSLATHHDHTVTA